MRKPAVKYLSCVFNKPFTIIFRLRYNNTNITTNTNQPKDSALACCTKVTDRLQDHLVSPALWKNQLKTHLPEYRSGRY
jgi:hypothetical protein